MPPTQSITFRDADSDWEALLGLKTPPLVDPLDVYEQFDNVVFYAADAGCESVAVETHYIDRDHIEDHSSFYSKSFESFGNYCKRVHFFSQPREAVERKIEELHRIAAQAPDRFTAACEAFSHDHYLGFMVVRPLNGSPVGRTLVRVPDLPPESYIFPARTYSAHLLGIPLTVKAIPFQQQDEAVSACATTALWGSLQHARKYEDLASVSPARITQLASQYRFTLGRAMPSEGLTVEQMCAAIEGVGMAASLLAPPDFVAARAYLHSMLRSGFAPALVIATNGGLHAVTVVGADLGSKKKALIAEGVREAADRLTALYIHDDRIGPYVRAEIQPSEKKGQPMQLLIERSPRVHETWELQSMVMPIHPKIRLSFATLHDKIARSVVAQLEGLVPKDNGDPLGLASWMVLAQNYTREMLAGTGRLPDEKLSQFLAGVALPRYLGVVNITSRELGRLEVLVDTTSTPRQVNFIAVLYWSGKRSYHAQVQELAQKLECPYFGTT